MYLADSITQLCCDKTCMMDDDRWSLTGETTMVVGKHAVAIALWQDIRINLPLSTMATDTGRKTPRRDSVVGSINSPDGTAEVVRGFCSALKAFNSEQGFQSLAELVDRVPKLEADLLGKERALALSHETSEREREVRQNERHEDLQLYSAEYKRWEKEKTRVEQRIAELQTSITKRDQAIAEKEAKEASLKDAGRKFEDLYRSTQAKLKARDGEITQLKQQNQDKCTKAESLAADLKKSRGEVSSLDALLQNMQQHNAQLGSSLKETQDQQKEIASYSAELQDIDADQLAQELSVIWVSVTLLIRKFVGVDLNESMLKRDWKILDDAAGYLPIRQLPQSNTQIAKELRVVKVLAILAESIHKHLLQPLYQPPNENCALSGALYDLASIEPNRERILRGMLLAALEDQREQAELQLLDWIIDDVVQKQGVGMVIRPDLASEFEDTLENILTDVQDIWHKVQLSTQVFESRFDVTQVTDFNFTDFERQIPGFQPSDPSKTQPYDDDDDVVILFPTIFRVGNEMIPITTGTIVRKSRISALVKEERHISRSAEPDPPRPRQRQRTMSMSMSSSARNGTAKEAFLPRPGGAADGPSKV
ncbi:uncharacterized protein M421DRAFT_246113 [Didymella exigua CBS 183.55]|uniref:Uncharacterized protein n=1 Tax=Didymella exigua CBS 183.55 TaxID=1150837 RepID=A0A6A5RZJ4_9PLEO|nr:uncharacterized protein M421DRAFT_246113 [Didymella exigua CBS 183.55]KAF1932654.1 hypothetical protein M421DRAFT_246113 [Didymella exigua CBS 183.55]